jgi:GTP cyclohydrolase I
MRKRINRELEPATEVEARAAVKTILSYIGEDPARDGLLDTPKRVVKAWDELTAGYAMDPSEILERDFEGEGYDQMIMTRRLQVVSCCEHHMLPFLGHAWIGYVPRKKVVGVSKMSRLLKCFMRRLQIQERLTKQIADEMTKYLNPLGVGVRIVAVHSCMSCRGVMEPEADMVTTALTGVFRQHKVKSEFLEACQ